VARFRKILVPVDFSEHAEAAVRLGTELAREGGGELHLLHAYDLPASIHVAYGVAIPQSVWDGVQEAARTRLERIRERVAAEGVPVTAHLTVGPAADAILDAAAAVGADLVVMGTRGLTGLKHALLGSVAERTLRMAPCPVLTVKAEPH
jgi:nucleotide-binding universal stress UspA family protein